MSRHQSNDAFDLPFGLILGLMGGFLFGVLFAPKPGKELQKDVQNYMDGLPNKLNRQVATSRAQYVELVDKTKQGIETQIEQFNRRKQAVRMAEAKRREEQDTGSYDY